MAELTKRFIHGTRTEWFGVDGSLETTNKSKYFNSIVFIKNDENSAKGDMIYTQGAYFEMNNEDDVKAIISSYLEEGKNIDFTTDENGSLVVNAVSLASLNSLADADKSKLVEAQAVAGALTEPFSLSAEVGEYKDPKNELKSYTTAEFTQHFTNLKGEEKEIASAVLVAGDNVKFEEAKNTDGELIGVEVNAEDTEYVSIAKKDEYYLNLTDDTPVTAATISTYSSKEGFNGTEELENYVGDAGNFTFVGDGKYITVDTINDGVSGVIQISADLSSVIDGAKYTGKENNPVVVDNENKEIYHAAAAITRTEDGDTLSSENTSFTVPTYSFDEFGHVSAETTTTVTLPETAFKNDNTTYDLDATANATKGVDVNLKGNDTTTDTVTFIGGSNVEVALVDGKVEISSSYVNDNTTYTGKNAIAVEQPKDGNTVGEISLKLVDGEKILSQDGSGLKSTLTIDYDKSSNNVQLKGIGGEVVSEFNASVFVEDSFLKDVKIVDNDGEKDGKFLEFTFETVDTDGTGDIDDLTKVIYVDVATWFHETVVEGNEATYSVVETGVADNGSAKYTVKNTIGLALIYEYQTSNADTTVTISRPKSGLVDTEILESAIEGINSHKLATEKIVSTNGNVSEGEIAVVTGIHQEKGHIISVDAGLAATKTYVDTTISTAIQNLDAEVTSTDGKNVQVKVTEVDGKITAVNVTETDIASAQDLADLTANVEENAEVAAAGLADLNGKIEEINEIIEGLDLGVSSVKASTSSNHVTVTPTTDTKGAVTLTVDVASVDATDKAAYVAKGLATDAYVDEEIDTAIKALDSTATGTVGAVTVSEGESAENYVNVVKGFTVTQTDGALASTATVVDERIYSTKYIDDKFTAVNTPGVVTLTNGDEGEYVFAEKTAGYVTAEHMAEIMNEAWAWGTI